MIFYPISKIDNMMVNIISEGVKEVWKDIEEIKNPLQRCQSRKVFASAIKKLNNQ